MFRFIVPTDVIFFKNSHSLFADEADCLRIDFCKKYSCCQLFLYALFSVCHCLRSMLTPHSCHHRPMDLYWQEVNSASLNIRWTGPTVLMVRRWGIWHNKPQFTNVELRDYIKLDYWKLDIQCPTRFSCRSTFLSLYLLPLGYIIRAYGVHALSYVDNSQLYTNAKGTGALTVRFRLQTESE